MRTDEEIALVESELDSLAVAYGGTSLAQAVADSKPESTHPRRSGENTNVQATDDELGANLVFLVSMPRSGSTLLQRVLANHPDVHTTAEPWVMLHPLYALKRKGVEAEFQSGLARRALDEFLCELPGGEESYIEALRAMASVLYGKALQGTGKRIFLDKTPRYFYILPELFKVFPKAKFVLLSRNPAAVLSSVLRTWLGDDVQALLKDRHYEDLVKGPGLLTQGMSVLGNSAVTVHYEDLVAHPADVVKQLCEHIGIPFQQAMLEYGQVPAPSGTFGDPQNIHRHGTVVNDYMETWRTHLADERFVDFAVNCIDSVGQPVFESLGYSGDAIKRALCGEDIVESSIRTDQHLQDPALHRDESVSLNEKGERAFNEGDLDLAEACFKKAYSLDPANAEICNNLVVSYWQKGDVASALSYLADGLLLDETDRNLVINGGQILVELNQFDQARQLYSGYLASCPDDVEVDDLLSAISTGQVLPEIDAGPKKFVIFTAARSGSNLLATLLRSHPDVECQYELFDPIRVISSDLDDEKLNDKDFRDNDPEAYLERLFAHFPDKKAVGFKVVPCDGMQDLVDYLISRDDIVKIVLERDNRLLSFSSRLIAKKTDQWGLPEDVEAKHEKVAFDESEFFRYLADLNDWFGSIRESLQNAGQDVHHLEYKELLDRKKQKELLEFLSVDPEVPLSTSIRKQNSDSYRDRFINPEEVKQALDKAGYSSWLIDNDGKDTAAQLNEKGEAVFSEGDTNAAIEWFREAHEADPDNAEILNNLGVAYWEIGDSGKAVSCLVKALEQDHNNRDAVINGGKILAALGHNKEASALCASYLNQFPDDDEVIEILLAVSPEAQDAEVKSAENSLEPVSVPAFPDGEVACIDFSQQEYASRAPRISVVIPSFNQGAYLETTIRSVLDQNYPDLELIVMDGGSSDNSVNIIKKYEDKITYWQSQPDEGQYWAVNEGFQRSTGEIMAWINSDDKLHQNCLNTMATVFSGKKDVEWVTGTPNVMNEAGVIKWICTPIPVFSQKNYLHKKYDFPSYIQQEGTFWRRSLWEKAGSRLQTKLQMAGDLELWARFFRYSPLHTLNVCTGCFREHGNQKTAKAMELYRAEAEQILD
jgi:Flp pilus assembly protein TadD/LPS sulfotransferase NodH